MIGCKEVRDLVIRVLDIRLKDFLSGERDPDYLLCRRAYAHLCHDVLGKSDTQTAKQTNLTAGAMGKWRESAAKMLASDQCTYNERFAGLIKELTNIINEMKEQQCKK